MIICVSCDDDTTYRIGSEQSLSNSQTFGYCYATFAHAIPLLEVNENLFLVGHGVKDGDDGNPVIGDADEDHFYNAVELYDMLHTIFPANYSANVYISTCESSTVPQGRFSFAETFKAQLQGGRRHAGSVYGHDGAVGGNIPLPNDRSWVEATV